MTVLMPVYNADRYLRSAIESVLNQSLYDFEFLIIDDGSTDESAKIVRDYSDSRIRFVQNEHNIGLSATLNKGLKLASCELVARMDADDVSYPQRLEKQCRFMQSHPNCVLLSNAVRYISNDKNNGRIVSFNNDHIYYNLIFTCWINTPVTIYRRSVILKEGGYLTRYAEDVNLWWRISRKYEFYHDSEVLLDYQFTDSSLWKAARKSEYDRAEFEQVSSNIKFYAGEELVFSYDEIAFFRKDPKELIQQYGLPFVLQCFRKLDQLNKFVFQKERGSRKVSSIKQAAFEKKNESIKKLRKHLRRSEILRLLIQLGYWRLFVIELKKAVLKKMSTTF